VTVLLIDWTGAILELELPAPLPIVLYTYGCTYRHTGELSIPPVYRRVE
jgi:hypothetical protein